VKKTLAILLAGTALVLGVVWWGGRREVSLPVALEPRADEDAGGGLAVETVTLGGKRRRAGIDLPTAFSAGSRSGRAPAYEPSLATAATEPVLDFARVRPEQSDNVVKVWKFSLELTWVVLEDDGIELRLEFKDARSPTAQDPWLIRVWGIETGRPPAPLGAHAFAGDTAEGVVRIEGSNLAQFDQVFVLRAAWRDEPPAFVASASAGRASGALEGDRTLRCPGDAAEPCTVLAWWRLEADGSFGLRRMPLPQGEDVFVQGRYSSLFSLE